MAGISRLVPARFLPRARRAKGWVERLQWVRAGRPIPPPRLVKQNVVRSYAASFGLGVFVETGTFLGEMVDAMLGRVAVIHSIELDSFLFDQARRKYQRRSDVNIHHGDSTQVLPRILDSLREPAIFWLDAHYSCGKTARGEKETPIVSELEEILRHPIHEHVVLVDDARAFGEAPQYPSLDLLRGLLASARPRWVLEVADDIIRMHLPKPS